MSPTCSATVEASTSVIARAPAEHPSFGPRRGQAVTSRRQQEAQHGAGRGVTAGGCPNFDTYVDNPRCRLTVGPGETDLLVQLEPSLDESNVEQAILCIDCLTEFVQGNTSLGNMASLIESKASDAMERLVCRQRFEGVPADAVEVPPPPQGPHPRRVRCLWEGCSKGIVEDSLDLCSRVRHLQRSVVTRYILRLYLRLHAAVYMYLNRQA